jgi:uncharacterized OB-fold protein
MTSQLPTPMPAISPDNAPFWAGTTRGLILLPRCRRCGRYIWYPRHFCATCATTDVDWVPASGLGTIYTFTIMRSGRSAGPYADALPYVLAFVTLDEGPTIMTNLVEFALDEIRIGQRVRAVFHQAGEDAALPRFSPAA